MGLWRKKNDGFEWSDYVRTTILLRRQERRQKIEDVKAAALDGAIKGGKRGIDAAAAGVDAAQKGVGTAATWTLERLRAAFQWGWSQVRLGTRQAAGLALGAMAAGIAWLRPRLANASAHLKEGVGPLTEPLRRPQFRLPVTIIALVSTVGSVLRFATHGLDHQALIAGGIALVAGLLAAAPHLLSPHDSGGEEAWSDERGLLTRAGDYIVLLPFFERMRPAPAALLFFALILAAISAFLVLSRSREPLAVLPEIPVLKRPAIEGRATAVSGDTLEISGRIVRLEGIEAPALAQDCDKAGARRWRCGESARDALARAIRGKTISCAVPPGEKGKAATGRCAAGETDLALELVRSGHVFAETGLFSSYAGYEQDARDRKEGLWAGEAERPEEWKARLWQEAEAKAPAGCPIKGEIRSGSKRLYLLPWSPRYERAKIYEKRGERWFCSESEAVAAGWAPADND